jgi:predicted methyltransferase
MRHSSALWLLALGLATQTAQASGPSPALLAAVANPSRSAAFVARDPARHPAAELSFFGLRANETVVEISPGGGYWTEILAPYLAQHGTYYVALSTDKEEAKGVAKFRAKLAANPSLYGKIHLTSIGVGQAVAPAGSANLVLTFRNLHNWLEDGTAPQMLASFYEALKPGGVLGIEDHRAGKRTPPDPTAQSGYVQQAAAIALVEKAGFKFVASSEIDANPKDTANYPQGVWTLPPVFALGAKDHAKYAAIGEADNFVLKFRKPAK